MLEDRHHQPTLLEWIKQNKYELLGLNIFFAFLIWEIVVNGKKTEIYIEYSFVFYFVAMVSFSQVFKRFLTSFALFELTFWFLYITIYRNTEFYVLPVYVSIALSLPLFAILGFGFIFKKIERKNIFSKSFLLLLNCVFVFFLFLNYIHTFF